MRKSGTIHIVNKDDHIPFDVRQYRAVEYSTDLSELTTSIAEIKAAIDKRLQQGSRSDNPVHDTLPQLPIDALAQGSQDQGHKIRELQEKLERLSTENDSLREEVAQVQANPRLEEEKEIDAQFDEADRIMQTTGENVLLRLNEVFKQGGKDQLVAELRKAIKSPYLTELDFSAINNLLAELGLEAHRLPVLKEARKRFPESRVFFRYYTAALLHSPSRDNQEAACRLLEEFYGVKRTGDEIVVERPKNFKEVEDVFGLFDYYIRNDKPHWALALIEAAEPLLGEAPLLLRNKARALAKSRQNERAEDVFKEAIQRSPGDDTLFAFYGDFLDDLGRYQEAFEQAERALTLDPQDGNRYFEVAVQILNRGYCRDEKGELHQLLPRKARLKAAAPFLIAAATSATRRERTQDVIGLCSREYD